ncbi:MAG: DUF6644 family protein, partial [Wenzhouxiangellaceae bacterium]
MHELMAALEGSAWAEFLRGLGVWTYGVLNLFHVLGIAMLFGSVLLLDLRLLGLWRDVPVAVLARPTVPVAAAGFVLVATSGSAMISFNTTEYLGNPFLYVKLPLILVGLINVVIVQRLPVWRRAVSEAGPRPSDRSALAAIGGISLATWLGVIVCGRMIGYW